MCLPTAKNVTAAWLAHHHKASLEMVGLSKDAGSPESVPPESCALNMIRKQADQHQSGVPAAAVVNLPLVHCNSPPGFTGVA